MQVNFDAESSNIETNLNNYLAINSYNILTDVANNYKRAELTGLVSPLSEKEYLTAKCCANALRRFYSYKTGLQDFSSVYRETINNLAISEDIDPKSFEKMTNVFSTRVLSKVEPCFLEESFLRSPTNNIPLLNNRIRVGLWFIYAERRIIYRSTEKFFQNLERQEETNYIYK